MCLPNITCFKYPILIALLFVLGACSVSDRISYEDTEGEVPEALFEKIRKNKTRKSWIVSNLGDPHLIEKQSDSQEVYTYRFTRSHYRNGQILLIFRYGRVKRDVEYFHVAFENGVVKKHWMDEFAYVQMHKGAIRGFSRHKSPSKNLMPKPEHDEDKSSPPKEMHDDIDTEDTQHDASFTSV